ncbi:MAG TPA: DinB family protein [Solirubrobacterales bacterium]
MSAIADRLADLRASRRQTLGALSGLTEAQLALPATWRGRTSDVRYWLLRLADSDEERRITLGLALDVLGWRQPEPARILGGRLGVVRSILVGVPDDVYLQKPTPTDWSVGQALEHLRIVEERYLIQTEYAVERLGSPDLPMRVPDDRLPPIPPEPAPAPTVSESLARLESIAADADSRLSALDAPALLAPSTWSGWDIDVRFRLHRFGAHARQHAVQVAKALDALGWHQSEAQMILGQAEVARAALEGALLGLPDGLLGEAPSGLIPVGALLDQAMADEEATRAAVAEALGASGQRIRTAD